MGWVPTSKGMKEPLKIGSLPTAKLEYITQNSASFGVMLQRLLVFAVIAGATVATAMFVFTKSFAGISFLNKASKRS